MSIKIKIVGAVTEDTQLEEIESIAKIFAYEQRMKEFHSPKSYPTLQLLNNPPINKTKKPEKITSVQFFVHGLL
ncbi:MAG: hypothetical protein QXX20_06550 [Candidatus Thermoplasmatota archaeon]